MSDRVPVEKATITQIVNGKEGDFLIVQFNPVSLQYTVTNTVKDDGRGKDKKQAVVTQVTGKLSMDLIFDNTDDGQSVQLTTSQLALYMGSPEKKKGKQQTPPILLFEWGSYKFQGVMESYKETLDFFSAEGVPLRASVNISLVEQTLIFSSGSSGTQGNLTPDAVDVPTGGGGNGAGRNPHSAATQGGNPSAARAIAALNGEASLRFSTGSSLTVSGSVQLGPPVAFATGSAGISAGAGAGIGIGAGASAGGGGAAGIGIGGAAGAGIGVSGVGGIGIGASASAGIGISGSASAGVAATEGAFAGLRVSSRAPSFSLNTDNFIPPAPSLPLATGSNASFQVGGQAVVQASAGLTADVGANADLRARIQFKD